MKLNVLVLRPSDATWSVPEMKFYSCVLLNENSFRDEKKTPFQLFSNHFVTEKAVAVVTVCNDLEFHHHFSFLQEMPYAIKRIWSHFQSPVELTENVLANSSMSIVHGHKFAEDNPLVSVITSTFHSGERLLRPLHCLQQQTYANWEWVIWDDSKDESMWPTLQQLALDDFRIKVFRAPRHSGYIGEMKRLASSVATGKWLMEVDHDDEFDVHLIQWIVQASRAHPEVDFIYTDACEIFEDTGESHDYGDFFAFGFGSNVRVWNESRHQWITHVMTQGANPRTLRHIVGVPNHVRVWKTSFYNSIGRHAPTMPVSDDYELLLRSFLHGKWLHIPVCAYFQYRNRHGNNFTFLRNELIQHTAAWTWSKYEQDVLAKFRQLKVNTECALPFAPVWHADKEHFPTLESAWLPEPFNVSTTISIIMPTYNRADELRAAINSVCAQTDKDWILFIVGDNCPVLPDVMKAVEKDPTLSPYLTRIRWWNLSEHKHQWGAISRNYGLRMLAKTDWVAYLDDDNTWLPSHLASLRKAANANPKARGVFASFLVQGKPIPCTSLCFGRVDASSFMHKRDLASQFGFWPTEASYANDWAFVDKWKDEPVAFTHEATLVYSTLNNAQTYESILALAVEKPEEQAEIGSDVVELSANGVFEIPSSLPAKRPLAFAAVPRDVELSWNAEEKRSISVALTINDRYFGFFEPFSYAFDAVLTGSTKFDVDKTSSVTCFMSTNILQADTPVKALTLYQTEQLSRAGELARVVHEIDTWCKRGVSFTVWEYSKFNMKTLQNATKQKGLQFHHEYKPLVTPAKEILKLRNLLRVVNKQFDIGFSCGHSDRRMRVVKQLEGLGFRVKFMDSSFSQDRDVAIASCKVLLNIHADTDFRVFETSRCLRWLDAGMTVVTEESEDLVEYLDKYPNLILVPFESIWKGDLPVARDESAWVDAISSAWKGHRPFAEWLVSRTQARTVVDLGVDHGFSTFVWGLAARKHGGCVFGVDMFEGDQFTGKRNTFDEVTERVKQHKLESCVKICRSDFSSLACVWSKPIDILHIDGNHTLEAVREDFESWSPHVKPDGIILFHDTHVEEFGVKDFFASLDPECCTSFSHSFGLGIFTRNKNLLRDVRQWKALHTR
jgi:glycosyltransferase involved in cell wall biosynthesis